MARRSDRLTAAITGKAREVGPEEAHARTLLALGRVITQMEKRMREATATAKRLKKELRGKRREFRVLAQRNSSISLEQLEVGGKADGVDRAVALSEQRRPADVVEQIQQEAYAAFGAENDGVLPEVDELGDVFGGAGKDGAK
jgi:hypothetical protein